MITGNKLFWLNSYEISHYRPSSKDTYCKEYYKSISMIRNVNNNNNFLVFVSILFLDCIVVICDKEIGE